jgi:hypothetical protein
VSINEGTQLQLAILQPKVKISKQHKALIASNKNTEESKKSVTVTVIHISTAHLSHSMKCVIFNITSR